LPLRLRSPIVPHVGLLLAAVLALAALAGCGTATLDTDKAENGIKSNIEQQTGAQVSSVDCPGDVKAEKGKSFTCEATGADGTKATINVTQTNDKGDVKIDAPLLHTGSTEQFIAESIRGRTGRRATVDCPDLVDAKGGARLTCRSNSGGKTKNVAVKVDAQGHITWNLGD
jgi:hypothetical protein